MTDKKPTIITEKQGLHPRNPHRFRYDFGQLIMACPELAPFVRLNKFKVESVDFADPKAVKLLNQAILKQFYDIGEWNIPENYLCPPIPGRADYIHYVADLLATCNKGVIPTGKSVSVLDIGVGANCVYPIIGNKAYGWHFVGTDIDPVAIRSVNQIIGANPKLQGVVECRLQTSPSNIFSNIIHPGEFFDLSVCNPPFHASAEEARSGSQRKTHNLTSGKDATPVLNFGGQSNELWCNGGEAEFVRRIVKQSSEIPDRCFWFSSLISKKSNLPGIYKALQKAGAKAMQTIDMAQGQKLSRIVAWSFLSDDQQNEWRKQRWSGQ